MPGEGRRASRPRTVSGAAVLYTSSAQGNFRLARFYRRSSAFIGGQYGVFAFALDREKKHIWAPMNADNPEVLRSGGSSGVAGISTFMSRTGRGAARKVMVRTGLAIRGIPVNQRQPVIRELTTVSIQSLAHSNNRASEELFHDCKRNKPWDHPDCG